MPDPTARWVFEILGPLLWLGMLAYFGRRAVREGRLPTNALIFIAATTMWWQEWYGDWGAYLLYNPKFGLLGWGSTTWTTPNKPWFVIPAYGWYYAIIFPLMLGLMARLRLRRPRWGRLATLLVVTVPLFYLWDLLVEGVSVQAGYWSYTFHWGPALTAERSGFPLVFPLVHPLLLFVFFGVVATWVMDQRDDLGRHRHEVLLGAHRLKEGWRRELARAWSWVIMMNAAYWILLMFPLIGIRLAAGPPSALVP